MMRTQLPTPCLALMLSLAITAAASANYVHPYSPDASTAVLYHLDESTGATTAVDASSSGLDLTAASISPFLGVSGPDGLNGAGSFDKSDSGYQLTRTMSAPDLANFSTTDFTIEAWVRNPDLVTAGDHDGILAYRGSAGRFQFSVFGPDTGANAGKLNFNYNRDDTGAYYGSVQSDALSWDTDTWYHVAVTYDSNTAAANDSIISFYRNSIFDVSGVPNLVGTLTGQPDIEPLDVGGDNRLILGGFETSALRSFGGDINEVRYTNDVLTSFNLAIPTPAAAPAGLLIFGAMMMVRRRG